MQRVADYHKRTAAEILEQEVKIHPQQHRTVQQLLVKHFKPFNNTKTSPISEGVRRRMDILGIVLKNVFHDEIGVPLPQQKPKPNSKPADERNSNPDAAAEPNITANPEKKPEADKGYSFEGQAETNSSTPPDAEDNGIDSIGPSDEAEKAPAKEPRRSLRGKRKLSTLQVKMNTQVQIMVIRVRMTKVVLPNLPPRREIEIRIHLMGTKIHARKAREAIRRAAGHLSDFPESKSDGHGGCRGPHCRYRVRYQDKIRTSRCSNWC